MSDQPAKARTEKWEPSDFCKRGEHGWCMNRNPAECHCGCPCHEQQRPTAEAQLAATHAAIRALPKYWVSISDAPQKGRELFVRWEALARLLGDPEGKG